MTRKTKSGKLQINLFARIPRSLRQAFRAWCSLRGLTMQDKFLSLIRDTIKGKDKELVVRKDATESGVVCTIFIPMPLTLRQAFKAWCELRDISMQEKVMQLMQATVKETQVK